MCGIAGILGADQAPEAAVRQMIDKLQHRGPDGIRVESGPGCEKGESEHWFRKNFAKTWAAYSRQGVKQSGHLPGLFEITNHGNGYHDHIPPPKLVGDPAKARAVLEAGRSALMLTGGPEALHGEIRALADVLEIASPEQ